MGKKREEIAKAWPSHKRHRADMPDRTEFPHGFSIPQPEPMEETGWQGYVDRNNFGEQPALFAESELSPGLEQPAAAEPTFKQKVLLAEVVAAVYKHLDELGSDAIQLSRTFVTRPRFWIAVEIAGPERAVDVFLEDAKSDRATFKSIINEDRKL